MAVANSNVTADQLISATVKYSNKDDASRVYDISANARIENGNVNGFESGYVRKSDGIESNDGMGSGYVANFSAYGERSLNLNINNASEEESKLILESVYAFMSDVKANVSVNPITA